MRAGVLSLVVQSLICLTYIGNTAAFNALISAPTLLLAVSYSIVAFTRPDVKLDTMMEMQARTRRAKTKRRPRDPSALVHGIHRSRCRLG